MQTFSAPAKLVVSGEYAVLHGAPALVLALNRRVKVSVHASSWQGWQFDGRGLTASSRHSLHSLIEGPALPASDPGMLCQQLLLHWPSGDPLAVLPADLAILLDSSALFEHTEKLGLGSSAAVTVALATALATAADFEPALDWPLRAHRAAQKGRGSGLDVAAAWHGGLIRFRPSPDRQSPPSVVATALPAELQLCFVYAGFATSTVSQLSTFEDWCRQAGSSDAGEPPAPLRVLADAASEMADATSNPVQFMAKLRLYTEALQALDQAAGLGIFSAAHRQLAELAARHGLIYKPCGAGGGDMGMAFGLDAGAMTAFEQRARAAGFTLPAMEPDPNGRRRDS